MTTGNMIGCAATAVSVSTGSGWGTLAAAKDWAPYSASFSFSFFLLGSTAAGTAVGSVSSVELHFFLLLTVMGRGAAAPTVSEGASLPSGWPSETQDEIK